MPVNRYMERYRDIPTNPNPFMQLQPQETAKSDSTMDKSEGQVQAEKADLVPRKESTRSHSPSSPVLSDNILGVLAENGDGESPSSKEAIKINSKHEGGWQWQDVLYLGEVLVCQRHIKFSETY